MTCLNTVFILLTVKHTCYEKIDTLVTAIGEPFRLQEK